MSLDEENRRDMINHYLYRSDSCMIDTDEAMNGKRWNMAANRLYYALLNAVRALLIADHHSAHSHDGAKILFGQYYVITGEVTPAQGKLFSQLETLRERSDYNCYFEATEEMMKEKYEPTKELIDRIKELVRLRY